MIETNIETLIKKRISTRGFLDKEVTDEQLQELMQLSTRAPSWKNAQSYKLIFLKGKARDAYVQDMLADIKAEREPEPHYAYENKHPSSIKKRMFNLGMSLYGHMGIDRKDKAARDAHFFRNYEVFGAPVIGFFYIPTSLAEWTILDLGILMGHLCLVAEAMGLSTCFQAALSIYPDIADKYCGMDENWKMVVGMSLGYADPDDQNNSFYSDRAPMDEVMQIIS